MGAVYLAEHPTIGKKVALKVIHKELASNREVVQRFFQEARAVNKIGNEHIVEIHDVGVTPEGDHYYIMEFLEGKTLASVLTHQAVLDVLRSLHIGAQIANALGSAHKSGIIHRDLKPDNIMLMMRMGDPDFVKVLDFGLAKMFQGGGASAVQTAAGVLLGTPQYMSPEACESKRDQIDHRTDIYALGVLLFQMMTGVLPFNGETMGEILVKQVTALPPAPRALNPQIPPSVEQILLRCLAKPPDARFPTMQALRDALLDPESYLRASPPIAPARSVAPGEGVTTAQVMAAVEERQRQTAQRQQAGYAATAAFDVHQHGQQHVQQPPMPLAPPNSLASQQRTMIDAGQYARPQPAPGAPAPTLIGQLAAAPPAPLIAPNNRTMVAPHLQHPQMPAMNTMRIATPLGHTSRPARKMWPIVLVLGLVLGLGGGGLAVYLSRSGSDEPAATPADAAVAQPEKTDPPKTEPPKTEPPKTEPPKTEPPKTGSGSGSATVTPLPATVKLTLDSAPSGATVYDAGNIELGTTPLKLDVPVGKATFTLKLKGYKDKQKEIELTANTMTRVELDRVVRANPTPKQQPTTPEPRDNGAGNGLERPD